MAWQRRWLRCTKLKICTILIAGLIITAACRIHSFLKTTRCRNDEMKENFNDLVRAVLLMQSLVMAVCAAHMHARTHMYVCIYIYIYIASTE